MLSFQNQGVADLRALLTMGVSVKGSDSAIGMFGTGFKYAISIILRLGGSIDLYLGKEHYQFVVKKQVIRGRDHDLICLLDPSGSSRELGFTTHLGYGWEPWMAYRELRCNAMDENGSVWTTPHPLLEDSTTIQVRCGEVELAHESKDDYFSESYVVLEDAEDIQILKKKAESHATKVFYKGVIVLEDPRPSPHHYNLKKWVSLSEDRMARSFSLFNTSFPRALTSVTTPSYARAILDSMCMEGSFENQIEIDFIGHAGLWRQLLREKAKTSCVSYNLKNLAMRIFGEDFYGEFQISDLDRRRLDKALKFLLEVFNIRISQEIKFVDNLPTGTLGMYHRGNDVIYITRQCLSQGTKMLAGTLYEEYLHASKGLEDESRDMQNYIIDELMSMGEEKWDDIL